MANQTKHAHAQHTPGPWQSDGYLPYEVWTADRKTPICRTRFEVAKYEQIDVQIREANANLIAAAPDLLEQLKALVNQLESMRLIVPPNVQAAIAKAEGR